jgi:hypothetical protein
MEERKKNVPDKLEMGEQELYSRKGEIKNVTRHEVHTKGGLVPESWNVVEDMPKKKKKKHLMYSKKFRSLFLLAIVFFVGSVAFAFLTFFRFRSHFKSVI